MKSKRSNKIYPCFGFIVLAIVAALAFPVCVVGYVLILVYEKDAHA
jgi:hypothetical protein